MTNLAITAVAAILVAFFIRDWFQIWRAYGGLRGLAFATSVLRLVRVSNAGWMLWLVPLQAVGIVYLSRSPVFASSVESSSAILLALWVPVVTYVHVTLRPPMVLFLGSSARDTLDLLTATRLRVLGFGRLIHLLDPTLETIWTFTSFADSSLRTRRHEHWRGVVDTLAEVVPVIVIDTRFESAAVAHELQLLLGPRFRGRTIFVVKSSGQSPLLHGVTDANIRSQLQTTDPAHCPDTVYDFLKHRTRRPRRPAA